MMAQYKSVTLPVIPFARALHRASAVVWQLNNGSTVESRASWDPGTQGLSETPADPEGQGWTRLTPVPS